MATWIKETDKAIYLMEGGFYIDKIDKTPKPNGEQTLNITAMESWFKRLDAPGGMVIDWHEDSIEPQPKPPVQEGGIELTNAPKTADVNQIFTIEGKTSPSLAGKPVSLYVDNQLTTSAPKVGENGLWKINYRFFGAGNRQMKVVIENNSATWSMEITDPKPQRVTLALQGSVGRGGRNNSNDVKIVKERLLELGYNFFPPGTTVDTGLIQAIKLFQSIITGKTKLGGDGRVDVGGGTHQWLQAANAPQWIVMPIKGEGFYNYERDQLDDHHDYGTSWLSEVIIAAAKDYESTYRKGSSSISVIPINDVSYPQGGDTPDHASHECGNCADVSLPRLGGDFGGITWRSSNYDRNATRAMMKSFRRQSLITRVLFNDQTLINEGLCIPCSGHDNHFHIEIGVPPRQ